MPPSLHPHPFRVWIWTSRHDNHGRGNERELRRPIQRSPSHQIPRPLIPSPSVFHPVGLRIRPLEALFPLGSISDSLLAGQIRVCPPADNRRFPAFSSSGFPANPSFSTSPSVSPSWVDLKSGVFRQNCNLYRFHLAFSSGSPSILVLSLVIVGRVSNLSLIFVWNGGVLSSNKSPPSIGLAWMMKCFFPFKDRSKRGRSLTKSAPTTRPVSPVSVNGTGPIRSYGSTPTKQTSKSSGSTFSPRSIPALYEERAHNLRVFELKELRQATNDFNRMLKIGEGGFGSVYKGIISNPDGQGDRITVAIKKLNNNGKQGHKQWLAEVLFLGVVEHPNLVKLIGYCAIDGEKTIHRSLVYEFLPNKSLEDHLFNKAYNVLPWITRLRIALGAAEGLAYLHEGLEVPVIYRDFKSSNVLLDSDFKPKLSDFGLAREGPLEGRTHVTTAVVGTYGYAAPDYIETGKLTVKSDVWSFGVVLYEIITGRRTLERFRPAHEKKLLEWVKQYPIESRRFYMIIDPRLGNQYSLTAARMVAALANRCLMKNRHERASIKEVIEGLKQAIQATETSSPKASQDDQRSSTDSERDKAMEQAGPVESSRRRMEHLAKMTENLSLENKMRFMSLQGSAGNS